MKPESSLPHSQVPVTCPYPKPDRTSPCLHIPSLENLLFPTLKLIRTIFVCHFCPFHSIRWHTLASTWKLNCKMTATNVTMLLYVCWIWEDTVTSHDCLELLFSQWGKQMGDGTAEQQARMLPHNCNQWRILYPLWRTEVAEVRIRYIRITSQKRYQSYNLACKWNYASKTLLSNMAPS
jgi:hypothetical protein